MNRYRNRITAWLCTAAIMAASAGVATISSSAAAGDPWDDTAGWPNLTAKSSLVPGTNYFSYNEWKGTQSPDASGASQQQSQIFSVNEEAPHTDGTLAYPSVDAARQGALNFQQNLGYYKLLTASTDQWDLTVMKNEADAKSSGLADNFYKPSFDVSAQPQYAGTGKVSTYSAATYGGWKKVTLPASWQTQGFDFPIYSNFTYPWSNAYGNAGAIVPVAPTTFNPIGFYRRSFTVDPKWLQNGFHVYIDFDGVGSSMYLYMNGNQVGYSEGSYNTHEFDITPFLKTDGSSNLLAVRVQRWSDSSYGEDQDMFRLSGIFRDVSLHAAPPVMIRDYTVQTDLDADYTNATLSAAFAVGNGSTTDVSNYGIDLKLFDDTGTNILEAAPLRANVSAMKSGASTQVSLSRFISNPKKWSAESPNLYTMVATLYDKTTGKRFESVGKEVGFRKISFTKTAVDGNYQKTTDSYQQVLINGQRLIFRGTDFSENDPDTGLYVSPDKFLADIKTMKQNNINAIRTSHYTDASYLYYLCDKMGIYVLSEADFECHGAGDADSVQPYLENYYRRMLTDNIRSKRNDPSIVMWSLGNESGSTGTSKMFQKAIQQIVRPLDGTRPVHYEPLFDSGGVDVASRMYPTLDSLDGIGQRNDHMPFVMCEYDHAMGNEVGGMDQYWAAVKKYPNFMGGFIWDWKDKSIAMDIPNKYTKVVVDQSANQFVGSMLKGTVVNDTSSPTGKSLTGQMSIPATLNKNAGDINDTLSGNHPFTLEMTVRQNSDTYQYNSLLSKGDSQMVLRTTKGDGFAFYTKTNNGWKETDYNFPANWIGNWHKIAAVFDGQNYALYCDGVPCTKIRGDGGIGTGSSILKSNYDFTVNLEPETGRESDNSVALVRVYKAALSQAQITAQEAADTAGSGYVYGPDDPNVLMWLNFGQSTVQQATVPGYDVYKGTGMEGKFFGYGGSYEDVTSDSDYCADGLVSADGTVQPEMAEVKYQYQDISISGDTNKVLNRQIDIQNESAFTDLSKYDFAWALMEDGTAIQNGALDVSGAPGQTATVTVPYNMPTTLKPDAEYYLDVSAKLKTATLWADAGYSVACGQLRIPAAVTHVPSIQTSKCPDITSTQTADAITLTGSNFSVTVSKTTGIISNYTYKGKTVISNGPVPNYWRARTDSDMFEGDTAWGDAQSGVTATVSASSTDNKSVTVSVTQTLPNAKSSKQYLTYTVYGSGEINVQSKLSPNAGMGNLLKVGASITLPVGYENVTYYGKGPQDGYSDRQAGGMAGVYKTTATDSFFPYIRPQDSGNKMDVRYIAIEDPSQPTGLLVVGKQNLQASALHFSWQDYQNKKYPYQMPLPDKTVLNVDMVSAGLGTATNGPTSDAYRIPANKDYAYEYTIVPYDKSTADPNAISKVWRDADSFDLNAYNQQRADDVVNLIDKLQVLLIYSQKDDVDQAQNAYDALTDAQKALVTNKDVLTQAEAKIESLKGTKAFVRDMGPNKLDGEITDTAKIYKSDSPNGYCIRGYFQVPDESLFKTKLAGNGGLTLDTWVSLDDLNSNNTFIAKGDTTASLKTGSATIQFFVYSGGWQALDVPYPADFQTNQWHHLTGTYDGSALCLYIDGVLKGSKACSVSVNATDFPVGIGKDFETGRTLRGELAVARIFSRALTADEVSKLHQADEGQIIPAITSKDASVLAWYDMGNYYSSGSSSSSSSSISSGSSSSGSSSGSASSSSSSSGSGSSSSSTGSVTSSPLDPGNPVSSVSNTGGNSSAAADHQSSSIGDTNASSSTGGNTNTGDSAPYSLSLAALLVSAGSALILGRRKTRMK